MNLLKFFAAMQGMAGLQRYSQTKLAVPENVLEHTGFVTLACVMLGAELNSVANSGEWRVDLGELLVRAAVHDMDELWTGDIPRPTKYASKTTERMFHELKIFGMDKILTELNLSVASREFIQLMHEKAKADRLGAVVNMADKTAVVFKIWDEVIIRNNNTMIKHALGTGKWLPTLRNTIKETWFNPMQRFYLLNQISNMEDLVRIVALRDQPVYGIIEETAQMPMDNGTTCPHNMPWDDCPDCRH